MGLFFLANNEDGLRACTYNGDSFTNTAHIDDGEWNTDAIDVLILSDGNVILANGNDGLRAYTYNGSSFTNTAHINDGAFAEGLAVSSEETIYLANNFGGLHAYTYDGSSFTNTAHIDDGGGANGVAVSSDGSVFLASWYDGLRAYLYDGSSFYNTAYIYAGDYSCCIAISPDETVFLANGNEGLIAYIYTPLTSVEDKTNPIDYNLYQNYPNPFNPNTVIKYELPEISFVTIKAFDVLGREVATLVNEEKLAGYHNIEFNASSLASGIYFYRLQALPTGRQAGSFVETKKMVVMK